MDAAKRKKEAYDRENRISFLQMYVNHCVGLAARSPDPSTKVGCVIIDKECRLLAQGYNGEINSGKVRNTKIDEGMRSFQDVAKNFLKLKSPSNHTAFRVCDNKLCTVHIHVSNKRLQAIEGAKTGGNHANAPDANPGNPPSPEPSEEAVANPARPEPLDEANEIEKRGKEELLEESSKGADGAIHAEMNALLYADCGRDKLKGAIAIVSLMPCPQCFKLLAQTGISYVIILSDSGRYLDTLRLIGTLGEGAPLVVPLDLIAEYIDAAVCLPTKVFKSKLAPFIYPPSKPGGDKGSSSSTISSKRARKNPVAELPADFDYNYDAIEFMPSKDHGEKSLDALFRILFKNPN